MYPAAISPALTGPGGISTETLLGLYEAQPSVITAPRSLPISRPISVAPDVILSAISRMGLADAALNRILTSIGFDASSAIGLSPINIKTDKALGKNYIVINITIQPCPSHRLLWFRASCKY